MQLAASSATLFGKPRARTRSLQSAIGWVKANRIPGSGVRGFHDSKTASEEVTGYLIPTLYDAGEKELASNLVRWEATVQRPDGSLAAPDGVPYTFDTAQAARGFLALVDDIPALEDNLRRACDYVERNISPGGEVLTASYAMWSLPGGAALSEYGNLYVLPPLLEAGKKLGEPRYVEAARRGVEYFKRKPDLVVFKTDIGTLSHYFGYMMEALVDLGEVELARAGLEQAARVQRRDGAIPAYPGAEWVCSTGVAQLAIAWYKLGERERADRCLDYLERIQNPSGGFYGSYGRGANYLPTHEISWGVKFFVDAWLLRERSRAR